MNVNIKKEWQEVLKEEFEKEYFISLMNFVSYEYKNKVVYPEAKNIFNAFNLCSFNDTKVVIIGQDPYHQPNQAHGLCFSVSLSFT